MNKGNEMNGETQNQNLTRPSVWSDLINTIVYLVYYPGQNYSFGQQNNLPVSFVVWRNMVKQKFIGVGQTNTANILVLLR